MSEPLKEKFGFFKELVGLVDTKFRAVITTILVLGVIFLIYRDQKRTEIMYERVIVEIEKRVPAEVNKQVAPIKSAADSTNAKVDTTLSKVDTTVEKVKQYINQKK